jgi:hypothetical protein
MVRAAPPVASTATRDRKRNDPRAAQSWFLSLAARAWRARRPAKGETGLLAVLQQLEGFAIPAAPGAGGLPLRVQNYVFGY